MTDIVERARNSTAIVDEAGHDLILELADEIERLQERVNSAESDLAGAETEIERLREILGLKT